MAFQLSGRGRTRGFSAWLVDFLIRPDRQNHPAAVQTAENVFFWTLLAVAICAVITLVVKLWWESQIEISRMDRITYGPSRSRVLLLLSSLAFILIYLGVDFWMISRFAQLMGIGNVIKLTTIGLAFFIALVLLLMLVFGLGRHMPWRSVR